MKYEMNTSEIIILILCGTAVFAANILELYFAGGKQKILSLIESLSFYVAVYFYIDYYKFMNDSFQFLFLVAIILWTAWILERAKRDLTKPMETHNNKSDE